MALKHDDDGVNDIGESAENYINEAKHVAENKLNSDELIEAVGLNDDEDFDEDLEDDEDNSDDEDDDEDSDSDFDDEESDDIDDEESDEIDDDEEPSYDDAVDDKDNDLDLDKSEDAGNNQDDIDDVTMVEQIAQPSPVKKKSVPKDIIDGINVELTFETARQTITLGELSSIKEGYTFVSQNPTTSLIEIRANGKLIGHGRLVSVDGRIGVQITEIL